MTYGRWWMVGAAVLCWSGCGSTGTSAPAIGAERSVNVTPDHRERLDSPHGSSTTDGPSEAPVESGSTLGTDTAEVITADFDTIMKSRIECGRRPRTCDVDSLAVVGSPLHDRLTALMGERRASGITASRRGSVRYRIDGVEMSKDGRARVTTCLTDDTVLVSAGAIFDESLFSAVTVWVMERVDDRWLWVNDDLVSWSRKEDVCGFAT